MLFAGQAGFSAYAESSSQPVKSMGYFKQGTLSVIGLLSEHPLLDYVQ